MVRISVNLALQFFTDVSLENSNYLQKEGEYFLQAKHWEQTSSQFPWEGLGAQTARVNRGQFTPEGGGLTRCVRAQVSGRRVVALCAASVHLCRKAGHGAVSVKQAPDEKGLHEELTWESAGAFSLPCTVQGVSDFPERSAGCLWFPCAWCRVLGFPHSGNTPNALCQFCDASRQVDMSG